MELQSLIFFSLGLSLIVGLTVVPCESGGSFYNPILDTPSTDQYIYLHTDGYYYKTRPVGSDLYLYKSQYLSDWRLAERKIIHTTQPDHRQSEIHFLQGNWYIYFYKYNETILQYHMFVIRAENPSNPFGQYSEEIRLTPATPEEGYDEIDGTILETLDGNLYLIYSGFSTNPPTTIRKIFLAPMSNPTTIIGSRTLIRDNLTAWDKDEIRSPNLFRGDNQTFLLFVGSANGVSSFGLMGIDDGDDPLVSANWWQYSNDPVFSSNAQLWHPLYASFTSSPDFSETWMAYCASKDANDTVYTSRIQKINWNEDGAPLFPTPSGLATPLPVPSGEI